jgi:hypothetical protein
MTSEEVIGRAAALVQLIPSERPMTAREVADAVQASLSSNPL